MISFLFRKFTVLTIIMAFILTGCGSRQNGDVTVSLEVNPDPPAVGQSSLTVKLGTSDGSAVDGAMVMVDGNMDHEGMQPLHAMFKEQGAGVYQSPFSWTMEGDWVMDVTVTLENGQEITKSFEMTVDGMGDHDHDEEMMMPNRVPNNGAKVQIISPVDGATFKSGDEIVIQVATENFDLTRDGNHWHIYVDEHTTLMIMGGMTETTLRDLSVGQHEIAVYLSNGNHEDLEDGAIITITIEDGG
jgi:hypothetical protein